MLKYVNHVRYTYSGDWYPFIQLADILPSKTVPKVGRGSQKRKRHNVTFEEVEEDKPRRHLSAHSKSSLNDTIIEEIPSSESATSTAAAQPATAAASGTSKKNKVRIYIIDLETLLIQYCL